ncbi:MAG: DUF4136 domain-containing protein [Flaviramulus sp.]|nr:DUF4136 domain-containing protein [Flaviramulus sp.]
MKRLLKTLSILALLIIVTSCSSVRVATDYDQNVAFNEYKTFAFFKTGIDKAEINDLDKRRILRAIEAELLAKGFTKSENPDLLVSLFTKSQQRVDVYNNAWGMGAWGWGGWGWGGFGPGFGPGWGWGWNNQPSTSVSVEGVLYIDLIDANKKELVWQGMGTGFLSRNMDKKEQRIKEFVTKIMEKYPPESQK